MSDQRRIIDDALYVHFVTFSVDSRRKLLDHDHPKRIVLGVLNDLLERLQAKCVGYVIMPEHIHSLIWLSRPGQLSHFMKEWKRVSSLEIRKWSTKELPNYLHQSGTLRRFWQPKYYAFEIYSAAKLEEKLTYMHMNPVRRGLAVKTIDWKWSSARWYEQGRTVGVPIEWAE